MARLAFVGSIGCSVMIALIVCTNTSAAQPAADAEATPLPRYKLHVGQELVYRLQGYESSITFYVTRSNPSGGWHLFEISRNPDRLKAGASGPLVPDLDCEFDLMPDGRFSNKPVGNTDYAMMVFLALPPDGTAGDWRAGRPLGESVRFHILPTTQPSVRNFEGEIDGPIRRVRKVHEMCRFRFDAVQGLPLRIEDEFGPDRRGQRRTRILDLVQSTVHPATWARLIDDEASAVMRAHLRYMEALRIVRGAGGRQAADANAAALGILKDARSRLTLPTFRDVMDAYIERHPLYASMNREPDPQSLVGHEAPPWVFPDVDGQRHTLADYRGKVVVLDFCYWRCMWCIVEAPHLKKVAERYAGKPVAFLAMNMDADPKDARLMVEQQHIPFTTLVTRAFARPATQPANGPPRVNDQYHVNGYPTLIVIGPDGIVRHVQVGYNDRLEEELPTHIDQLLPAHPRDSTTRPATHP